MPGCIALFAHGLSTNSKKFFAPLLSGGCLRISLTRRAVQCRAILIEGGHGGGALIDRT
jgi:hypothetical protein